MNKHQISEDEINVRIDKLLAQIIPDYSRKKIQEWLKNGMIQVNQETVKPNYKCRLHDKIEWEPPLENKVQKILAENIPLSIVYEDDDILLINKPKGMIVHPTSKITSGTVVNALMYHTDQLSSLAGHDRPGIVHRLDQDTSGLLLIAKNDQAYLNLKQQFQNHTIKRYYEALVFGLVQHENGMIQAPIGRNPKQRTQMAVVEEGKPAETHFKVLNLFKEHTHLECELITGRTHQIRVHLKYMGHPIVGDRQYVRKKSTLIKGQALFAKKLSFIHPLSNEVMTFEISPPNDFKHLIEILKQ